MTGWQIRKLFTYSMWVVFLRGPAYWPVIFCAIRHLLGFKYRWMDKHGFAVEDKWSLICYWSSIIDRDLDHSAWIEHFQETQHPVLVDVGANVGDFIHRVRLVNPNTFSIAVEPQPSCVGHIEAYKARTGANIAIYACGCSDTNRRSILYTRGRKDACATLYHQNLLVDSYGIYINLVPLDHLVDEGLQVDLLKIDCQDHDLEVIRGAQSVLQRTRYLLVEARHQEQIDAIESVIPCKYRKIRIGIQDYLFNLYGDGRPE